MSLFHWKCHRLNQTFCLAGIKSTNVLHCLHGSVSSGGRCLDGVAVVSDIVASLDPLSAAKKLATIIGAYKNSSTQSIFSLGAGGYTVDGVKNAAASILTSVRKYSPLVHQVRNILWTFSLFFHRGYTPGFHMYHPSDRKSVV